MTTSVDNGHQIKTDNTSRVRQLAQSLYKVTLVREVLIVLAFCVLTSVQTWPYVTRLRDAVSGRNDPYLTSFVLWWDYHATFTNPLNLFHANILYPYRYTLAFSEHCYGIALLFFPLFALGLRPLTVHAIAVFFGFVLSGYAAFRLARTLTGSNGAAWVTGILFAFVPYRFNMLGQLMYLFSVWPPLLFEAFILFARQRSNRRAVYLAVTFFMLGASTTSWFLLSTIPLALSGIVLLTRYGLWRNREFWMRGIIAIAIASVALLPFMVPYYIASSMYHFKRRFDEVRAHSALPFHWLVADSHNRIWRGLGVKLYEAWKFEMFPGLLALLLPLTEVFLIRAPRTPSTTQQEIEPGRSKLLKILDWIIVGCFALSLVALGFYDPNAAPDSIFRTLTSERALSLLSIAIIVRLCISYPNILRRGDGRNLIETIKSERRSDAFWVGVILAVVGFLYSLGWNFFFYRILYDFMPGFKSMRAPMRGALLADLGLAILAGLGAKRIADCVGGKRRFGPAIYVGVCLLLLIELNATPLFFIRGEVYPDSITLRLKETQMKGGIAYFPFTLDLNHQYTLRAADHLKPLISATSSFNPPYFDQLERLTNSGPIPTQLMDLLEKIPASYVVIENKLIQPERRKDFLTFLEAALKSGRLRFVNRFDGSNDLYAVTAIEPQVQSEAPIPPELMVREWSSIVEEDPKFLPVYQPWSQALIRLHVATFGEIPRYTAYMNNIRSVGRGVVIGSDNVEQQLQANLRNFTESWTHTSDFEKSYGPLDHAHYVDRLTQNAGIVLEQRTRDELVNGLGNGSETRASVLLKIVNDQRFVEKERARSLVLLYYFTYFRRNPDDPPDHNLEGFNYWVKDTEHNTDPTKLETAFRESGEYKALQSKP